MRLSAPRGAFVRRLRPVLFAATAIWALHRAASLLGTRPLADALAGYTDAELLAPGGELALELVVIEEDLLAKALGTAGLWLLAARLCAFLATFWLGSACYALASDGRSRAADARRLNLGWALPLVAAASLASAGLALAFAWGLARHARSLRHDGVTDWPSHVGGAALAAVAVWLLSELWLDLFRQAVAGARLGPLASARSAARTWFRNFGPLISARAAVASLTIAAAAAGVLLLPVVTRGDASERLWAAVALDLGLFGSLCLRAAWLTWLSAHLVSGPLETESGHALKPESSEAAEPNAEPGAPADPNPSPDA